MELPDVPLFRGLTADEAETAVTALRMRRRAFVKGEILLEAGQRAPRYSFRHSLFNAVHCSFRYSFFPHSMLLYQPCGSAASAACFSPGQNGFVHIYG